MSVRLILCLVAASVALGIALSFVLDPGWVTGWTVVLVSVEMMLAVPDMLFYWPRLYLGKWTVVTFGLITVVGGMLGVLQLCMFGLFGFVGGLCWLVISEFIKTDPSRQP